MMVAIPEFRDSFVRWGAIVVWAANKASRDCLRDTLPRLLLWEGAKSRMAAMGELEYQLDW